MRGARRPAWSRRLALRGGSIQHGGAGPGGDTVATGPRRARKSSVNDKSTKDTPHRHVTYHSRIHSHPPSTMRPTQQRRQSLSARAKNSQAPSSLHRMSSMPCPCPPAELTLSLHTFAVARAVRRGVPTSEVRSLVRHRYMGRHEPWPCLHMAGTPQAMRRRGHRAKPPRGHYLATPSSEAATGATALEPGRGEIPISRPSSPLELFLRRSAAGRLAAAATTPPPRSLDAVSYTHLTLPTICSV